MTKATEEKWRTRVAEWRESGMTAEEFASGRGFEASTLRFWSSRLRHVEETSSASEPTVAMARVVRASPVARDAGIEVVVGGARVVLTAGFDAELLREVVAALGGVS
jgi:hypothetical protein